jgi:hypothetical protein
MNFIQIKMNEEPLLNNENEVEKEIQDDFPKNEKKEIIEIKIEGYGNHDAYNNSNIISKLFFCWVNKVLRVKKIKY